MVHYKKTINALFVSIVILIAVSACKEKQPESNIDYPHMRVLSSQDIDLVENTHAKFNIIYPMSFGSGEPWTSCETRDQFREKVGEIRAITDSAHARGITVISYISKTMSSHASPEVDSLEIIKTYHNGRWNEYEDFFGPKPDKSPKSWIEVRADGELGGYTWVSPSGEAGFHSFGCSNNPYFQRYMRGVVKILGEMGIDGFYLDHTEGQGCYGPYCDQKFREFIKTEYPQNYLAKKYANGITSVEEIELPTSAKDPLWVEWKKFISKSQLELHKVLLEEGKKFNKNFIVSGNLFGAGGFGFAALNGSDIEIAGNVDVILYSEIVPSTESQELAYYTIPGFRDDTRISNSPLYKHMVAAHHQGPVLVYPLYPESPNPVSEEAALYNTIRLVIAETFANHTSMRRVQGSHSSYVHDACRNIYELIEKNEEIMTGARLYSNVAVLTSLNQFYHGEYSLIYSASRSLSDAGISHIMLTEEDLFNGNLQQVEVVVMPHLPLLSDDAERKLETFVKEGGSLVFVGPCGIKDQYGEVKEKPVLVSAAGVNIDSDQKEMSHHELGAGVLIYLPLNKDAMRPYQEIIAHFNNNISEHYNFSLEQHKVFGRGEFPAEFQPVWEQLPQLVEQTADKGLAARLRSAATAEITSMRSPDENNLFVHVVNYNMEENGAVTPLTNTEIVVRIPENRSISSAQFASASSPVPAEVDYQLTNTNGQNYINFEIKDMELYGIINIKLD